jgi:phosphoribosylanthranilate isomerase
MARETAVKICGISTGADVDTAAAAGARYVGLVFVKRSPRVVSPAIAAQLARRAPTGMRVVGLFIEPTDEELEAILPNMPLDYLQLHGGELPGRVAEITARWGVKIIKAFGIREREDLAAIEAYTDVCDEILLDAKPPKGVSVLPGGTGISFDWQLLAGWQAPKPWLLAGGLRPDNVAAAITIAGPNAVDVSSGVEARPGVKDHSKINAFIETVKSVSSVITDHYLID